MLHPLESFKPLGTVEAGIVAFPERAALPNDEELDWGNAYHYQNNRLRRCASHTKAAERSRSVLINF